MSKYTVMVNYDEYGVGVFETEEQAKMKVVECIRTDEPYLSRISDKELLDTNEGYYRVLEIKEEVSE